MASWTGKDSSSTSGPGLNVRSCRCKEGGSGADNVFQAKMIPDLDIWALKMDRYHSTVSLRSRRSIQIGFSLLRIASRFLSSDLIHFRSRLLSIN